MFKPKTTISKSNFKFFRRTKDEKSVVYKFANGHEAQGFEQKLKDYVSVGGRLFKRASVADMRNIGDREVFAATFSWKIVNDKLALDVSRAFSGFCRYTEKNGKDSENRQFTIKGALFRHSKKNDGVKVYPLAMSSTYKFPYAELSERNNEGVSQQIINNVETMIFVPEHMVDVRGFYLLVSDSDNPKLSEKEEEIDIFLSDDE